MRDRPAILPGTELFSPPGAGLDEVLALGGAFDSLAVLTSQVMGALVGFTALPLAAIPLKARFARN